MPPPEDKPRDTPAGGNPPGRPVLGYAGAGAGPRGVTYDRDGAALVITIPPCPAARLLAGPALWLLAVSAGAAAAVAIAVVMTLDGWNTRGADGVRLLLANALSAVAVWAWFVVLWRFVRLARYGRRPTVLRADDDRLSVASPLWFGRGRADWPRDDVADLTVRLGGAMPAVQPWLYLRLSLHGGGDVSIDLPWPPGEPTLPLEVGLRLALGLPTSVSVPKAD